MSVKHNRDTFPLDQFRMNSLFTIGVIEKLVGSRRAGHQIWIKVRGAKEDSPASMDRVMEVIVDAYQGSAHLQPGDEIIIRKT